MQNFKNKLFNYEAYPPEEVWQHINEELQNEKVVKISGHKRSKNFYYLAVAAASLVIIFLGSLFFKKYTSESNSTEFVSNGNSISSEKMNDSMALNHKILESIIHSPKEKQAIVFNDLNGVDLPKKYLTVAGPEGQPVRISQKVATLIIAADNEFPPKPTWSKKVDKWQKIMLSSTISPTSAGLADLIQDESNRGKLE
ncbi:MAG: hypothetical protein ABI136_06315 [Ginsengibacter sp.]